jgi:hypothetical protein
MSATGYTLNSGVTETELTTKLALKSNTSHTHIPSDVTGLSAALAAGVDQNGLTTGESTCSRIGLNSTSAVTSGVVNLTYWTAAKTETITQIRISSGGTAAAATPTLCRVGLFTIDGSGNLTLAAAIANDTTLFAAINTEYTRTLTSSFSKVAGTRYASGVIVVTAVAAPTFYGPTQVNSANVGTIQGRAPRICGAVTGQSDLPASVAVGSITSPAPRLIYMELLP